MSQKHILIVVAEDWSFLSHRVPLARQLKEDGHRVSVACRVNKDADKITQEGFNLIPLKLARESISPATAVNTVKQLVTLYRQEKPDVIVHSSLFLSFLGSIAGILSGYRKHVNLITGLGFVFISDSTKAKIIRSAVKLAFRFFARCKSIAVVVQNKDDQDVFEQLSFKQGKNLHVVVGSGVDDQHFHPADLPSTNNQVTFVGRLLWAKGIQEIIDAARILKNLDKLPKIVLVGEPDIGNPQSASPQDMERWEKEGLVEFWGRRSDISAIYQQSTVAILPSWREGLPKSLLEAAACGLPLIATDVPGCRELVQNGHNGILVPLKDPEALAMAIASLCNTPDEAQRLGTNARRDVETKLNTRIISQQTAKLVYKTGGFE